MPCPESSALRGAELLVSLAPKPLVVPSFPWSSFFTDTVEWSGERVDCLLRFIRGCIINAGASPNIMPLNILCKFLDGLPPHISNPSEDRIFQLLFPAQPVLALNGEFGILAKMLKRLTCQNEYANRTALAWLDAYRTGATMIPTSALLEGLDRMLCDARFVAAISAKCLLTITQASTKNPLFELLVGMLERNPKEMAFVKVACKSLRMHQRSCAEDFQQTLMWRLWFAGLKSSPQSEDMMLEFLAACSEHFHEGVPGCFCEELKRSCLNASSVVRILNHIRTQNGASVDQVVDILDPYVSPFTSSLPDDANDSVLATDKEAEDCDLSLDEALFTEVAMEKPCDALAQLIHQHILSQILQSWLHDQWNEQLTKVFAGCLGYCHFSSLDITFYIQMPLTLPLVRLWDRMHRGLVSDLGLNEHLPLARYLLNLQTRPLATAPQSLSVLYLRAWTDVAVPLILAEPSNIYRFINEKQAFGIPSGLPINLIEQVAGVIVRRNNGLLSQDAVRFCLACIDNNNSKSVNGIVAIIHRLMPFVPNIKESTRECLLQVHPFDFLSPAIVSSDALLEVISKSPNWPAKLLIEALGPFLSDPAVHPLFLDLIPRAVSIDCQFATSACFAVLEEADRWAAQSSNSGSINWPSSVISWRKLAFIPWKESSAKHAPSLVNLLGDDAWVWSLRGNPVGIAIEMLLRIGRLVSNLNYNCHGLFASNSSGSYIGDALWPIRKHHNLPSA